MEKHRPSFFRFLFLRKNKECYCKNCGITLRLNEKQKRVHFIIIPVIYTFVAATMISLYLALSQSFNSINATFLIKCCIIVLMHIVLYLLITLIEYFIIRFEPVQSKHSQEDYK